MNAEKLVYPPSDFLKKWYQLKEWIKCLISNLFQLFSMAHEQCQKHAVQLNRLHIVEHHLTSPNEYINILQRGIWKSSEEYNRGSYIRSVRIDRGDFLKKFSKLYRKIRNKTWSFIDYSIVGIRKEQEAARQRAFPAFAVTWIRSGMWKNIIIIIL